MKKRAHCGKNSSASNSPKAARIRGKPAYACERRFRWPTKRLAKKHLALTTRHKNCHHRTASPQGEDFIFLQNIIASNEAEAVKIAALERLNGQQHFGALNTALSVLNKDNANLSLAALNIVKNSRDTSLIPNCAPSR